MMDEVQKQNKFLANSVVNVAGTPVSVAARSGAPKPDISSVDAFKHTLLNARSIVYADPAKGGVSGVHFARVLDRLNIAEPMKGKTILVPGAQAPEVVARGEAELGIAQGSEIVPVAGAQLVGPLPGDLTSTTVFAAAIGPLSAGGSGSRSRVQPSSKNETPKSGLGDQGPEWHFCSPIHDTETARYLRNAAVPRRFEGPSHVAQWRPDWLAGVAGFETLHFE